MPFARKFENGMGFPKVGQVIKGFTIESVSVSHVNIKGGYYGPQRKSSSKEKGVPIELKELLRNSITIEGPYSRGMETLTSVCMEKSMYKA